MSNIEVCSVVLDKRDVDLQCLNKCDICAENISKYTCPRCKMKTCSLACCLNHKEEYNCSGQRDKTEYVTRENYKYTHFISDYRLLEDIDRRNADRERSLHELRWKARNVQFARRRQHLNKVATSMGINLRLAPTTLFTRARMNRTNVIFTNEAKRTKSTNEEDVSFVTAASGNGSIGEKACSDKMVSLPLLRGKPGIIWSMEFYLVDSGALLNSYGSDTGANWNQVMVGQYAPLRLLIHSVDDRQKLGDIWRNYVTALSSKDQDRLVTSAPTGVSPFGQVSTWLLNDIPLRKLYCKKQPGTKDTGETGEAETEAERTTELSAPPDDLFGDSDASEPVAKRRPTVRLLPSPAHRYYFYVQTERLAFNSCLPGNSFHSLPPRADAHGLEGNSAGAGVGLSCLRRHYERQEVFEWQRLRNIMTTIDGLIVHEMPVVWVTRLDLATRKQLRQDENAVI